MSIMTGVRFGYFNTGRMHSSHVSNLSFTFSEYLNLCFVNEQDYQIKLHFLHCIKIINVHFVVFQMNYLIVLIVNVVTIQFAKSI